MRTGRLKQSQEVPEEEHKKEEEDEHLSTREAGCEGPGGNDTQEIEDKKTHILALLINTTEAGNLLRGMERTRKQDTPTQRLMLCRRQSQTPEQMRSSRGKKL
jgi:hypothetical protein